MLLRKVPRQIQLSYLAQPNYVHIDETHMFITIYVREYIYIYMYMDKHVYEICVALSDYMPAA
jgi:hypothetical protein